MLAERMLLTTTGRSISTPFIHHATVGSLPAPTLNRSAAMTVSKHRTSSNSTPSNNKATPSTTLNRSISRYSMGTIEQRMSIYGEDLWLRGGAINCPLSIRQHEVQIVI